MESDPTANVFVLPAREGEQRLHGYVRQHLQLIEQTLSFGVPYTAITEAVHMAGFAGTSVHTVEQAVYRARRYKPRFAVTLAPRPVSQLPASPPSRLPHTPQSSMKEEMAAIRRRFQQLARPPGPGEDDPLI
jgi:sugar/nucleoside kinase (ribokinase family)